MRSQCLGLEITRGNILSSMFGTEKALNKYVIVIIYNNYCCHCCCCCHEQRHRQKPGEYGITEADKKAYREGGIQML